MGKNLQLSSIHIVLWGIIAVVMVRILLVFVMGLMPQDAYYFFYSENLDWSFFDHPPMVALMLKFFTTILGENAIAIKSANFIITCGTVYIFYLLARQFLSGFQLEHSIFLILSTMFISILSLVSTPDVPLMFFWTLSLLMIFRAVESGNTRYWIFSGIAMGLAFDSKYTAIVLVVGFTGFLLFSNSKRKYLFNYRFLLSILFFFITIIPVIYWNIQNDWLSFKFQSSQRADDINFLSPSLKLFAGNIGTQIFLLLPVLFIILFGVLSGIKSGIWKNIKTLSISTQFLLWFSVPILAGFMLISLFYWVKMNWMMPGYIAAIILTAKYMPHKWLRYQIYTSVIFHFAFLIQVVYYPFSVKSDDTWWGWNRLGDKVSELAEKHPGRFIFSADGYKTSAQLNFQLDQKVYSTNVLGENGLQFSIVDPDLSHLQGEDALFIDSRTRFSTLGKEKDANPDLYNFFEHVEQIDPIILYNDSGEAERKFLVYLLEGYNPR
ncbi:glycosyltransferase family 39 protein [Membranihabitans maritimus]|uniref:glycosyltransferase family 39 protein n=1 Tax=Membranihabitans maritimus TaxID=2904244 RepID=UPI001F1C58EE|nr:glycosyltransferase family 39 protein [Membranihabitans maritimus]